MHIHLYVMDTIVLYVTSHTESVFIYVSPNTMQNQRAVLSRMLPVSQSRKKGRARAREKKGRGEGQKERRVRNRKIVIEIKRSKKIERRKEIEKKGGNGGTYSLSFFAFQTHKGPKVSVFVWLCQDFLAESRARARVRQEYRGLRRIVTRREFPSLFMFFLFLLFC